ncbi:MAG: biotin carboxylase N-terminal domain-containing protein [Myxococcota bacterium]|nr:biotin carboxylase N-terminal domain-containing protein [Myxococcota bacterium]
MKTIQKVLIANRGEIAVRICRTLHDYGVQSVAVYSEADKNALHTQSADEAVFLGASLVSESYLNPDRLIEAAKKSGADAVHPGYGFLSENAAFAQRVIDEGLIWIGPPPKAISAMGDKAEAKSHMEKVGVPVARGYIGSQDPQRLREEALAVGFPLMIKAVAGGGGRGIRIVHDIESFDTSLARAQSESLNAFGSSEVLLERYIENARHVEIQVFADEYGSAVHLFERDCSLQRRRQKIIEEAPSPAVSPEIRREMGAAAVLAATSIGYVGAGTVEFLLEDSGQFFFLEMNTRLQVEHPVTEMITGLDLVSWQLRIAQGEPLPLKQEQISFHGHAFEARIYAEDPARGFLPCTGRVSLWEPAEGMGCRFDVGISKRQEITSFYDPMIAKVITWGESREIARKRMIRAIRQSPLLGLESNRAFLVALLEHPDVISNNIDTGFVERTEIVTSGVSTFAYIGASVLFSASGTGWGSRSARDWTISLQTGEDTLDFHVSQSAEGLYTMTGSGRTHSVERIAMDETSMRLSIDGRQRTLRYCFDDRVLFIDDAGVVVRFVEPDPFQIGEDEESSNQLRAPMMGRVVSVNATPGATIAKGDTVVVIEAMKMEHPVPAKCTGVLKELNVSTGDQVSAGQLLGLLEES